MATFCSAELHLASFDSLYMYVALAGICISVVVWAGMTAVLMWCRDGGIDATIDHGEGFMSSKEVTDIYSTEEPQSAFHARVAFCLDIHNEVSRLVYGQ